MATIREIAEVVWRAVSANGTDKKNTLAEYVSRAKVLFGARMFYHSKEQSREEGFFEIPSYLLATKKEVPVVNNKISLSKISVLKGLMGDDWLVDIIPNQECAGELVRQSYNQSRIYHDERYTGGMTPYTIIGKEIVFIKGTDVESFDIIYVPDGNSIKDNVEVPDYIADFVQNKLLDFYNGNIRQDKTNNENADN